MTQRTAPEFGVRVDVERASTRAEGDHTIGCGEPPEDYQAGQPFKSGRVCAGLGTQLLCQLCPSSPNYWDRD